ncbi:type IV secretion protein Rhs, partial [filamentous cyanobacterium CCT1]
LDGSAAAADLQEDILQVSVEESLHRPSLFTLVLRNDYQPGGQADQPWKHEGLFQIGQAVTIGFDPSTTESKAYGQGEKGTVLEGEITAIEACFSEKTQAPVIVRGLDLSHRLHRGYHNRSFQNMTDSDIVKKIAAEVGLTLGAIDESGIPHDYLFQANQTNMAFLRSRAARIGFELFIQDGKLHLRKPKSDQKISLTWLKDLHSFRTRVSSAEQVQAVEVRAWDYSAKRSLIAKANTEQLITATENGRGSETSSAFEGHPSQPQLIVVDQPVFQPKEADLLAQTLCDELGGQFICADAKGEGNADIRPGRVIELQDLGPHSGQYYVTETRHLYQERVYTTEFSVRGLRGGDLLALLNPPTQLQPGQTFLVGIVTDNQDPDGMGRVKVKFPTLTEDHASNWARVVAIGAGNARGFDCLPEIDDEVLVGFEHGDIHRPYILGGVWNGQDPTPTPVESSVQDGQVCLRTFKTRVGHQLQFADGGGSSGAYLTTASGHKLHLSDGDGSVELTTASGSSVRISNDGNLTIKSTGALQIESNAAISLTGLAISLNAQTITSSTSIVTGGV